MNIVQTLIGTSFTLGKVARLLNDRGYPSLANECEQRIQELQQTITEKPMTVVVVKER